METAQLTSTKKKENMKSGAAKRQLDSESSKLLNQINEKVNKKNFGRKIRDAEIIALALRLLGPEHIKQLQEGSYREMDRLNIAHDNYQKEFGKVSFDQFVGKLLRGEVSSDLTPPNTTR